MRFNFRKITSVLASAVMLGSTIAIASAAAYPSPFIKSGAADVAIVIGAKAATIDNIAAVDIASNLQAELAKQTATSGTTGATATGGDSVNLGTSSQKLYYESAINVARTSITKNELPTLLADSSVLDDAGTEYSYKQSISPGSRNVTYSTSGGDMDDPSLLLEAGTDSNSYLIQYKLTFNKNLNISHADVQGNNIKILGKDFTIGASSTATGTAGVLYLYGAGTEKALKEGETASVEISDKTYSVQVTSVEQISSVNYVSVSVDGSSVRRIAEGSSARVGGLEVYAKTIHYLAKEAQVSYVDLNLGTKKLRFGSTSGATTVKEGSDETSITGTEAQVTIGSGKMSALTVNVSMKDSLKDYILAGGSFTDPIFGAIELKFASVDPTLDSTTRDSVAIDTDNSRNAKVTFTSALSGDAGEKTIYFAHDDDSSDGAIRTLLATSANKTIHLLEGESVKLNEYVIINAGDYGRILQLTEVPSGLPESTSKIQFEDVVTGKNIFEGGLTVGTPLGASTNIDGQPYTFNVTNASTATDSAVRIVWGSGATANNGSGSAITLFPRIKLAKGEWMAILTSKNITMNHTYSLPGVQTLADYEAGLNISDNSAGAAGGKTANASTKFGNVNYTIGVNGPVGTILGIDVNGNGASLTAGTDCLFNSPISNGAAILLLEEKKTTETGNADYGDAICVNIDTSSGTSPIEVSVSYPEVTGTWSDLVSLTSDSNKQRAVTRYGSYVEADSTDNDKVTIKYPDEQMYADLLITSVGAEVTTTTAGGNVAELGSVAVMDSEIDTVSSKNLIAVGGSCINTVAAKLLGSDTPICGADFTNKTGISADQFLIKVLDSPYATGKVAMLVAGYEGADTRKASTYLTANKPATTVGTTLKKQTATYADVV
jgi:hypothetical protein